MQYPEKKICTKCGKEYPCSSLEKTCECGGIILPEYLIQYYNHV